MMPMTPARSRYIWLTCCPPTGFSSKNTVAAKPTMASTVVTR